MIEIVTAAIVAAGAASAGGVGSLAWWTSGRHADGRADAINARIDGLGEIARRLPGATGQMSVPGAARTRRDGKPITSPRVIVGEIVASAGAASATDAASRAALCPRCGQRPVAAGAYATAPDGQVVPVCSGCLQATESTDAAIRDAVQGATCPGRLTLHEDGSTSCHGGLSDCWGGPGYSHGAPVACRALSHGCGSCSVGGAS